MHKSAARDSRVPSLKEEEVAYPEEPTLGLQLIQAATTMTIIPQAHALAISQLAVLFYPAAIANGLIRVGQRYGGIRVPVWATALAMLVSVPVFHIGRARVALWWNKRKAARLGATLPPMWVGKSIGNLDILATLKASWTTGYLSMIFCSSLDEGQAC